MKKIFKIIKLYLFLILGGYNLFIFDFKLTDFVYNKNGLVNNNLFFKFKRIK